MQQSDTTKMCPFLSFSTINGTVLRFFFLSHFSTPFSFTHTRTRGEREREGERLGPCPNPFHVIK